MERFLHLAFSIMLLAYLVSADKIVGVVEVCRHGARSPNHIMDWNKDNWSIGGEVTPVGMRMHWLNGFQFRRKYIDNAKIIPPLYNSSNIYVQSTHVNRTIRSAESQLQGLFPEGPALLSDLQPARAFPPIHIADSGSILSELGLAALPANYQPVPIHMLTREYDRILHNSKICPRIQEIANQTVPNLQSYIDTKAYYEANITTAVTKLTGVETPWEGWHTVSDNLFANKFAGIEIPDFFKENWDWVEKAHGYRQAWRFPTKEAGRLGSSEFFKRLIFNLEEMIAGSPQKFVFYSAHDTTLAAFLIGMGWDHDILYLPYASTILWELWESFDGKYYVKIIYNDEKIKIPVEQFKEEMTNTYNFYSLKKFLMERTEPNITLACEAKNPETFVLDDEINTFLEASV